MYIYIIGWIERADTFYSSSAHKLNDIYIRKGAVDPMQYKSSVLLEDILFHKI